MVIFICVIMFCLCVAQKLIKRRLKIYILTLFVLIQSAILCIYHLSYQLKNSVELVLDIYE